jgi:hypothetical protein
MKNLLINNEECRQILGFERYHISTSGRVYRTELNHPDEQLADNEDPVINESKIHYSTSNHKIRHGRVSITNNDGKLHNLNIALLVAETFGVIASKKIKPSQEIEYIDGSNKNLHFLNLRLVEKKISNYKLNERDVAIIRKHIKNGTPLRKIAKIFSVSDMQINRIKTGENWGNGKRKIKAPKAPFEIDDVYIRKHIATFDRVKSKGGIKKPFKIKRNPKNPTDNLIVGILKGYKLSLKHSNITRARITVEHLNNYFFPLNRDLKKDSETSQP